MLAEYKSLVDEGKIKYQQEQFTCLTKLDSIAKQANKYYRLPRWLRFVASKPRGMYIYGDVGRGKSFIMDMFYEHITTSKIRVHFHEFMQDIHKQLRIEQDIIKVADNIAKRANVLCFDEFQVSDIADAMVLGRLFGRLFELNITLITTSNRVPNELYKNGLNRDRFIPTIKLIEDRLDIFCLNHDKDYRMGRKSDDSKYLITDNQEKSHQFLLQHFMDITNSNVPHSAEIMVGNREIVFNKSFGRDILWGSFDEFCNRNLGANDYITIGIKFGTIFIENIPRLTADNHNSARRFINLIDQLYESKTNLYITCEVEISEIYNCDGKASFEFQRTVSRLHEMQSW